MINIYREALPQRVVGSLRRWGLNSTRIKTYKNLLDYFLFSTGMKVYMEYSNNVYGIRFKEIGNSGVRSTIFDADEENAWCEGLLHFINWIRGNRSVTHASDNIVYLSFINVSLTLDSLSSFRDIVEEARRNRKNNIQYAGLETLKLELADYIIKYSEYMLGLREDEHNPAPPEMVIIDDTVPTSLITPPLIVDSETYVDSSGVVIIKYHDPHLSSLILPYDEATFLIDDILLFWYTGNGYVALNRNTNIRYIMTVDEVLRRWPFVMVNERTGEIMTTATASAPSTILGVASEPPPMTPFNLVNHGQPEDQTTDASF